MGLCKYCEGIDPDAIREQSGGPDARPGVDHDLQPSRLMRLSAQNGCSGCQFFLGVLTQEIESLVDFHKRQFGWLFPTGDFLQPEQRIWITAPFCLATDSIAGSPYRVRIDLNICLVQAEHDPDFTAPSSGPYKPISQDPSTEACMGMATSWLRNCASHEYCPPQAAVRLPTRLIEIPREAEPCKLHISAPGEQGHYVTLSHCWGSAAMSCLKKANIVELQRAIHVEDLSRSFQDAILITRRLGFRFLWIDAMCIIQDSLDDWAHESSLMADIYRNGSLMISALAAPGGQHGILRPRNNPRSHNFGKNKELLCQTQSECLFDGDADPDEPLHSRGWCLQEHIMAPRILHFGKKKLTWECVSRRWAEDYGLTDTPSWRIGLGQVRMLSMPFVWPSTSGFEGEDKVQRITAFYRCVSEFTKRKLTKRSDKLPALSGLASAFQSPGLGAYLAGLWENDLAYGLNWHSLESSSDKVSVDGEEYVAPSWSWASMPGRCEVRDTRDFLSWRPHFRVEFEHFDSTLKPQMLSYHIELATSDPYGRVSAASITVRAYTRPILLWSYPPQTATSSSGGAILDREIRAELHSGRMWMLGPPHEYLPWPELKDCNAPCASDSNETRQFIALPVGMNLPGSGSVNLRLAMLILDRVEGREDTYRRVGHVDMFAPSEMDPARWEQKDLTLI